MTSLWVLDCAFRQAQDDMIVEVDCVRALQGDKFVGIGLCVAFIVEVDCVRPLQRDKFVGI